MTGPTPNMVFCQKYQKNLPALAKPPLPGDFGARIFAHISQQAWDDWMQEQTKVINELNLKVFQPEAQKTLQAYAEKFLFESGKSIHPDQK